jgi:hypothetical protein
MLISMLSVFILISCINRYLYNRNKTGLTPVITERLEQWKTRYKNDVRILLSTQQKDLINSVNADAVCFINEKTNVAELSGFLMDSESKYFAFAWQGGIIGDELFELIYSFYPKIIEQEEQNNSGIFLLEKGDKKQNYYVVRNFEPDNSPEWSQNSARIKVDSLTGNHSYFYNESEEFGTSVEFKVEKYFLKNGKITVLNDFMIEDNLAEVLLVFTTDRTGEMQIYRTSDISNFAKYPDRWYRAVYDIQFNSEIQESDVIKIYFWNIKKVKFQIDNLKLKFGNSQ